MQCIRPGVLVAPLQLGLGVQMHRHFASKFLIDSLYQYGFCSSYKKFSGLNDARRSHKEQKCQAITKASLFSTWQTTLIMTLVKNTWWTQYVPRHGDYCNCYSLHTHTRRIIPHVTVTKEDMAAVGRIQITHPKPCNGLASLQFEWLKDPTMTAGRISLISRGKSL